MALHWNIGDCENHKELIICTNPDAPEDEREYKLSNLTNNLIWATITVGIPKITLTNYKDFYARVYFLNDIHGGIIQKWNDTKKEFERVTLEDIERHVGLTTNASRISRAKFIKAQIKAWENQNMEIK